jgi:hypothetical protein
MLIIFEIYLTNSYTYDGIIQKPAVFVIARMQSS